jgi:Phytochelatin synthase
LDVARFKYPPFWVPLRDIWEAMATRDDTSNEPRGYFMISIDSGNKELLINSDDNRVHECKGCHG